MCAWPGRGGGSRYADIICNICNRKVNILPIVNTKILWMLSLNNIKHVQVFCGERSSAIAQKVAVSREFEARLLRRLENSLCQLSSKWVPFSN